MKAKTSGAVWLAAGVAAVALVSLMPGARPVLKAQLGGVGAYRDFVFAALGSGDPSAIATVREKVRRAAAERPDDTGAQLSVAEFLPERTGDAAMPERDEYYKARRMAQLRTLAEAGRRLDRPEVHAALLVNACMGPFGVSRPEEERLFDDPTKTSNPPPATPKPDRNAPEVLAMVREAAERGEARDPENAFFPLMSAVELLAENRDAEAWKEFHRAAQKPRFDDYASAGAEGNVRLMNDVNGGPIIAPARMTVYAAVLLPHYARIRAMARYAAVAATRREDAGDAQGGLTIRQDIARIGAMMRTDSRLIIGSLVGSAITRLASFQPDGTFPYRDLAPDMIEPARLTDYLNRLNAMGETHEAWWYAAEWAKREQVKTISQRGMERGVCNLIDVFSDCWLWGLGGGLLAFTGFALCVGGGTSLLARWVPSLGRRARIGVTVGFFVVAAAGLVGLAVWTFGILGGAFGFMNLLHGLSNETPSSPSDVFRGVTMGFGALILLVVPPCVMAIWMIVRAFRRNVGGWEYARTGLSADALRLTGILLVCYTASVAGAATLETRIHGELDEMIRHEGRYYARLAGTEWPGRVGETKPYRGEGE